jgi:predicted MFS family arabinose efflux permease
MALGALGAGLALASVGAAAALSVDALTFVGAFLLFRGVRVAGEREEVERPAEPEADSPARESARAASLAERRNDWEDAAVAWARAGEAWEESSWADAAAAWDRCASACSHAELLEHAAVAWERHEAARSHVPAIAEQEAEAGEGAIAGLRYLLRRRRLLLLISSFATATLATGLTNATLPSFLEDGQGLGSGGYGFGIAALATGLLLGEMLVGFSRVGVTAGRWIGAGLLVMAALFVVLALTVHAPTALLVLALIGLVDGTTDVLFETVLQRDTDPRYLGCVFGFASAFVSATMTGAFAVAPVMGQLLDPSGVILGAGICLVAASAIALLASVRLGSTRLAPAPA